MTRLDPNQPNGVPVDDPVSKPVPPKGPDGKFISPAAVPEETPKSATVADLPPVKPTRPAWLDQVALNLGFTQQDIETSDADTLGKAVALAQRHSAAAQQPKPEPPPPPPELKIDLGLTPEQEEEFGPEMMGVLKKIATDGAKAQQALEAKLAQYEQKAQTRDRDQMINTLESAVSGLGEEFAGVLGKGTLAELMHKDQASYRRRHFVLTTLQQQGLDYLSAPVEVIRERIRKQVMEDFPGMVKAAPAPAKPPANPQVVTKDQWDRGGSPAPTQRNGANEPPPREGGSVEDRHRGAITAEEIEDERIRGMLRKRKRMPAS
jgi:hypothetical protein